MAEGKNREEDVQEAPEVAADQAGKGMSKRSKLLLIVGGVFVLILAVGTPIMILSMKGSQSDETEYLPDHAAVELEYQKLQMEGYLEEELLEGEEPLGAIFPLETLVINLRGGGYLRIQIQLEFHRRDIPHRFYSRLVPLRDGLITLLAGRTREELSVEQGRDELRKDIGELANRMLRRAEIKEVYFTQFVIQ